jgi:Sortase domain
MTLTVATALVTCLVRGCSGGPAGSDVAGAGGAKGGTRPTAPASHAPLPPSPPVELTVPRMVIQARVVPLGLDSAGRLETPPMSRPHITGWYANGPSPGERGTSVLVGHRDTTKGPAIFLNLDALRPGDPVDVTREDRSVAEFTVDSVHTYARSSFPDKKVYGDAQRPELRLLTCGGHFDRASGYSANVVVFAHLTGAGKA